VEVYLKLQLHWQKFQISSLKKSPILNNEACTKIYRKYFRFESLKTGLQIALLILG